MPLLSRPKAGSALPVTLAASSTFRTWASTKAVGTSSFILENSSRADFAAAEATRGSTTEARKATVLITGLPDWLKGMGW